MDRCFTIISRAPCGKVIFLFLFLASVLASLDNLAVADDRFQGYPSPVQAQVERVLSAAEPGKEVALSKEVRLLRIRMHELGIVSINAIPDIIFSKAIREGWKGEATPILRTVREVSPFSVPMWAWLVKEDILAGSLSDFVQDFACLSGAIKRFGPALVGYVSWTLSFLSAAGSWFILWSSAALFMRARPSIEGDIQRIKLIPYRAYLAPVVVALLFLVPIWAGLGLAVVASIWLLLSVAYLRRGEMIIMTAIVLALFALLLGGGIQNSLKVQAGSDIGEWRGGEGLLTDLGMKETAAGPKRQPQIPVTWMQRFEKARHEMQSGNAEASEKRWTSLLGEGRYVPEVLNNRGITLAQQGRIREALSDFEAAAGKRPEDPFALWNAYQIHLQLFNLDRVRQIQPETWIRVQEATPFTLRPAEMEQGEWIASPMPAREIWSTVFVMKDDWIMHVGESDSFVALFHPFSAPGAIAFLLLLWLSSGAWNMLSRTLWVHLTCRSCGSRALVVRSREFSDICAPCRAKLGGGTRQGYERERRVQMIVYHRRFVRLASIVIPGVGGLWAGKELRALFCGIALSLSLAVVSCLLGGSRMGGPLIADLQGTLITWAFAIMGVIWIFGAAWGIFSFSRLQRDQNVAGERE